MSRFATLTTGILLLASSGLAQEATFESLGDLPGSAFLSEAYSVSADGSAVVGYSFATEGREAFRWEDGEMESLGDLPGGGVSAAAYGVSADGSVVVGNSNSGDPEGFRWEAGEMEGLGDLPGGDFASYAYDASADGSLVVGYSSSEEGFEAFRWQDGVLEGLGDLPGGSFLSRPWGVSDDGSVVIGFGISEEGHEAFRWEGGGMVGLGDLPGGDFWSEGHGVSTDGSVVVGYGTTEDGTEAFRWTNAGMEGLGDLPGGEIASVARAVSGDGSVVIGQGSSNEGFEAFIWTEETGMQNLKEVLENDYGLDLTGWTLRVATGISDDATVIVGYGFNPDGDTEGWRADLAPPAPAPENDDVVEAIVLTESGTYEGTNVNATLEDDEPEPSCTFLDWTTNFSVWWSFTASDDGMVTIDTNGSLTPEEDNLDTILSLHNASDLSEVACDDDGGEEFWSLIEEASVNEGETYLIRVAGYNESSVNQGTIQLTTDFQFGIADEATPEEFAQGLGLPTPNPVSGWATFTVAAEHGQDVTVEVFDVTGRRVQTLYDGALAAGMSETLALEASALPAGVYVIRATGEYFTKTQRVTIIQ